MEKFFCVICGTYWKLKKPKISYLLEKTLVLSIICSKWKNEDEASKWRFNCDIKICFLIENI